ncbi:MAG: helix-turn-helix transcriptional regulator [Actinomycetia bacterium]|nr:helix-turn-helix transcriptional regulator [Actinomycetes bacterium]
MAALAAEGRTNREIAAAVVLSVRTVESHLSAVYRKLGVATRAQLAAVRATFRGSRSVDPFPGRPALGAHLLERFLADGDPVAAAAAERAVLALRADPLVRVRWSVRVPAEETLLCLAEADTADRPGRPPSGPACPRTAWSQRSTTPRSTHELDSPRRPVRRRRRPVRRPARRVRRVVGPGRPGHRDAEPAWPAARQPRQPRRPPSPTPAPWSSPATGPTRSTRCCWP